MSKSQKVLNRMTKKVTHTANELDFKQQYKIIKEDLLKLRQDLEKGYDIAKSYVGKNGLLSSVFKNR